MAEKRDFMSELANEVEEKKKGKLDHIQGIEDYKPKERKVSSSTTDDDFDIPSMGTKSAKKPASVYDPKKEPVFTTPVEEEEVEDNNTDFDEEDAYGGLNGMPASYGEEQVVRVNTPKKQIPVIAWILLAIAVAGISFAIYWFKFAPHITLPDFRGKNISEVSTWAKQNKMESSAIATSEPVYSMEYEKGVVVEQSVAGGKKVKKDTPITFTVSNGPDPDEKIAFLTDIKSMTSGEIQSWISENKLLKAKVVTQYSDTVESGNVISYEVKNGSEEEFTRGTTLNVICSKGPAPAGQVTVDNFVGKMYADVESWANTKKIKLNKTEAFSDQVDKDKVISMDKKQGETLKEGDTLSVVVSKGKGVKIPNLVGYTKEQLEAWSADSDNSVLVVKKEIYNAAPAGSVIEQSLKAGSVVESGEVLELTISLYLPILQTNSREWLGKDYLELKAKVDEWNSKGARIQAGQYGTVKEECRDNTTPGEIIDYSCSGGTSDVGNGCERPLNLDARISYTISTGGCTVTPTPTPTPVPPETLKIKDYTSADELGVYANIKGIKVVSASTTDTTAFYKDGSTIYDYFIKDENGKSLTIDDELISGKTYVIYTEAPKPTPGA
mgnify:FL=1